MLAFGQQTAWVVGQVVYPALQLPFAKEKPVVVAPFEEEAMLVAGMALGILSLRGAYASKWNYIMAASLVMVVPAVLLFAVGQRYFIEGIVLTGVKG